MPSLNVVVTHSAGLHARPGSKFVQTAISFPCDINVKNISSDSDFVNAKSILSILTLGVFQGNEICIEATGDQAEEAIVALKTLIESNFGD